MCCVEQLVITSDCTAVKSAAWRGAQQRSSHTIMWLESHSSWKDTSFILKHPSCHKLTQSLSTGGPFSSLNETFTFSVKLYWVSFCI